jgi:hypothetical protein
METLIPLVIGYAVKYGIPAAVEWIDAIQKPDVTLADIRTLLLKHNKTTEDYLREARLRAGLPSAAPQPLP